MNLKSNTLKYSMLVHVHVIVGNPRVILIDSLVQTCGLKPMVCDDDVHVCACDFLFKTYS